MKKLLVVLLFIGMTLVATTFWLNHYSAAATDIAFELDEVQRGPITEAISATGLLKPLDVVAVGSPLSGEVVRLFEGADFNQIVTKDQPLVQLDDRAAKVKRDHAAVTVDLAQADLRSAEAAVEASQKAVTTARDLLKKEVIKQSKLDEAEGVLKVMQMKRAAAEVKVREAEQGLRAAELEFSLTTIRAPAAGIIIDKKVVLGQLVAPPASAQLFTIATDLQRMRIDAQIAEGDIGKVQAGLKATFTVYPYPDAADVFEGVVKETRLMATNVQGAVFFPAIIEVENRKVPGTKANEWMLRPGMTATIDIQRRRHDNVWKVPNAALNFQLEEGYQTSEATKKLNDWKGRADRDDWKCVWVLLKDNKPFPVFVRIGGKGTHGETGIRDGQFTEVLEWDPDVERNGTDVSHVIISAPPFKKPSILENPKLKLS